MKAFALAILVFSCTLTLTQDQTKPALKPSTQQPRSPQLHVIFVLEPKGVEYGRLNMENDTIMRGFIGTVQRGLGYPMQRRWLDEKHFTSKALQDTIAALKTTPNDIVILYYSGYGNHPSKPTEKFANWRLDDVKDKGLPISDVEGWLKVKNVHLALLIADCSTKLIKNNGVSALVYETVDLTKEIMKQLFLRNKGIVRLGSSAPALPAYINNAQAGAGTTFTNALNEGFNYLLNYIDPAGLPDVSFEDIQQLTNMKMGMALSGSGFDQAAVLEVKNWDGTPVVQKPPVAGAIPAGARWQGFIDNELAYDTVKKKLQKQLIPKLPPQVDLSMYAPPVLNQGDKGNCVAISIGYYMYSIMDAVNWNITDKNTIKKRSLSPYYLYSATKSENDKNCTYGIDPVEALEYFKVRGLPGFWDYKPNFCTYDHTFHILPPPKDYSRIHDYVKLFNITDPKNDKVLAVKQTLAEKSPVIVGIQTTGSLHDLSFTKKLLPRLKASVWALREAFSGATDTAAKSRSKLDMSWKPYQANALAYGHALCVVGYDDNKLGKGQGAFKLVNSWGSSWGEGGYFWMSYDTFGKFAKYGYQAYLNEFQSRLEVELTLKIEEERHEPTLTLMPSETGLVTYELTKSLRTGTKFKFTVDAKNSVDSTKKTYLHIISANELNGNVILRWVESGEPRPGEPRPITPANQFYYPSENEFQTLGGRPGLEYMLFLFSEHSREVDVNDCMQALNALKGPFPERVKQVFREELFPNRQILYKPKQMGFFLSRQARGGYVPLLVRMKHVP